MGGVKFSDKKHYESVGYCSTSLALRRAGGCNISRKNVLRNT